MASVGCVSTVPDLQEIGPECSRIGISEATLLFYCDNSKSEQHLPEVPCVSNQLIVELSRFKDTHSECTFRSMYNWVQDLYGSRFPIEEAPTLPAFTKSVERLRARLSKLRKQHSGDEKDTSVKSFFKEFTLPKIGLYRGRVLHFSPIKKTTASVSTQETTGSNGHEYKEMQQRMYAITRNANKKIKRRDTRIEEQKQQIHSQAKLISKLERNFDGMETKLSKLRAELSRISHRASYWRAKTLDLREGNTEKSRALHQEIQSLKDKVSSLDLENAEMSETIENILSSEEIMTYEGGKYTDNVRTCVYELLSLNVGVRNIAPAIRCVLKNIAQTSVGRLPSYGLTCQMIVESLAVVQAQLGEKLSKTQAFSTLQTDGTTKFGEHYATFDVRVCESKRLRHVFSGAAKDTLETLKKILDDLDSVQLALGRDSVSAKIVAKIKNTMSDRHAAEKLFNELLEDYRRDILPSNTENWKDMTEIEKDQLTTMNNFFLWSPFPGWISRCC